MGNKKTIRVEDNLIQVVSFNNVDYISLTDMARSQLQEVIIIKWLSLKSTIDYPGEWEILYNPDFNYTEFGTIRNAAGSNNFVLSVKTWIEHTNAIGISPKAANHGGFYFNFIFLLFTGTLLYNHTITVVTIVTPKNQSNKNPAGTVLYIVVARLPIISH